MCGIVGILSNRSVMERLSEGLKRLEYRGYDSAGIATLHGSQIERRRASGKLQNLLTLLNQSPIVGNIGIGHTRWATHGKANMDNAHPHATERVAVVHNGIIENFAQLKDELQYNGCHFCSETDTEVVVQLIDQLLQQGHSPKEAVNLTLKKLKGSFALAIIFKDFPSMLIGARRGSPLVIGVNDKDIYLGSDALAIAPWTSDICYLEDGDMVILQNKENLVVEIFDQSQTQVERNSKKIQLSANNISKGYFHHFMLKEIFEQSEAITETLSAFLNSEKQEICLPLKLDILKFKKIYLIACGSSYYASMTAKYWLEQYAGIAVEVDIASEFRYRSSILNHEDLVILLSQSGETIDTLAALDKAKNSGCYTLGIVNVPESSIARLSSEHLLTLCGPEIGVASTKAFTAQLLIMALIAVAFGKKNGTINNFAYQQLIKDFMHLLAIIREALQQSNDIQAIANSLVHAKDVLYLGRGTNYPIALEGALKLKEISYIHAEGYAAGELKHGPIALIDYNVPVVILAPYDQWFEKTLSNIQEVAGRGARLIIITDLNGKNHIQKQIKYDVAYITMPTITPMLTPIAYAIPVQLLAYYTALCKGTDVDQPRNLAKSVTVE